MILYNMKTITSGYEVSKFDDDMNVMSVSHVSLSGRECSCPAGFKLSCRHREMLHHFQSKKAIDTDKFFDYELGIWYQPIPSTSENGND